MGGVKVIAILWPSGRRGGVQNSKLSTPMSCTGLLRPPVLQGQQTGRAQAAQMQIQRRILHQANEDIARVV